MISNHDQAKCTRGMLLAQCIASILHHEHSPVSLEMIQYDKSFGTSLVPNRISRLCKDFQKLHCPYLVYEVSSLWFNVKVSECDGLMDYPNCICRISMWLKTWSALSIWLIWGPSTHNFSILNPCTRGMLLAQCIASILRHEHSPVSLEMIQYDKSFSINLIDLGTLNTQNAGMS